MSCENRLWRLTLDTNPEDCNYRCIMCEEHSEFSHFKDNLFTRTGIQRRLMPVEWLDKIMAEASHIGIEEVIPSTMGEPLLYSGVDDFFRLAKRYGLRVNLTTNGSFPRRSIDEWAQLIVPITRDVKISINGACKRTSESIMRGSNFDMQLRNIQHFVAARDTEYAKSGWYCSITLQLTFMQNNTSELADIVKMGCELRVDRIKGHHLWAHFPEIAHLSMKESPASIDSWNRYVAEADEVLLQYGQILPNGKKLHLDNMSPLSIDDRNAVPENYECPFLGRELWVSATGRIAPCCCPDEKRRSLGDFGCFPNVSLCSVIKSDAYNELLRNYKSKDVCRICNMRRPV